MTARMILAMTGLFFLHTQGGAQENIFEKMTFPAGSKSVFIPEGKNIHVKAPENNPLRNIMGRPPSLWDGKSKFTMAGNFEIMVDYSVNQLGPKTGKIPFEANAEIAIEGINPKNIYGINVNAQANDPMSFRINRFEWKQTGGTHYDIKRIPRASNEGRIGFRRVGSEIIFLAADGADQEVKELARLPYESKSEVAFKLSAFQGNGSSLMPVDVVFSNISIRADTMKDTPLANTPARGTPFPLAEFDPSVSFASVLDYDKAPARLIGDLKHGNDAAQAIKVEGKGLRVRPPAAATPTSGAQTYWYRESAYDLVGDFEISARYEVAELGLPATEGYGSLSVNLGVETSGPLGSYSFGRGLSRGDGQRYSITRFTPTSAGRTWDTQSFKTSASRGRLILRRVAERFHFLVQDEDLPIKELFQCPAIMTTPLKFRISTDQGGTNTGIANVSLTEVLVKAENIVDNGKTVKSIRPPTGIPDSETVAQFDESVPTPPRKWLYVVLGFGVAAGLGAAGFLIWRGKRSESRGAALGAGSTASSAKPASIAPEPAHTVRPASANPSSPSNQSKDLKNPNQGKMGK